MALDDLTPADIGRMLTPEEKAERDALIKEALEGLAAIREAVDRMQVEEAELQALFASKH